MEKKECVVLKGSAEGVTMVLDSVASINEIMDSIKEKIKGANGFFKGECNIFIVGRELSRSDELRILSVMKTVFPEANIIFKKEVQVAETNEIISKNHTDKGARFLKELVKAAEHSREMLKSDKGSLRPHKIDVKLYSGNVSSGETLKVQGDILVSGNVEQGGVVSAEGDIYIIGNLYGKAFAGCEGNENSRIFAAGFSPQSVTIANVVKDFDEFAQEKGPKIAYLMKREMFIEEFL